MTLILELIFLLCLCTTGKLPKVIKIVFSVTSDMRRLRKTLSYLLTYLLKLHNLHALRRTVGGCWCTVHCLVWLYFLFNVSMLR